MSKIFVVPDNDLEAVTIQKLLKEHGYKENEDLFVTKQGWGASWEGLESDIKSALSGESRLDAPESVGINYGLYGIPDIFGVELQGKFLGRMYHNIDHHIYENDDRSNELSSLEQVAKMIGAKLTLEEKMIVTNDKGYIPAMRKLAEKEGLSQEQADKMIDDIRYRDREAQGITAEQEEQAVEALKSIKDRGALKTVLLPHSKCATVTDRMYGEYENMLIVCGDGEVDFYGKGDICKDLQEKFGGWAGGDLSTSGFFGGYCDPKEVEKYVAEKLGIEIKPQVLWFSRHEMSDDQKAALGDVEITQIDRTINSAYELKDEIEKADIVAVVAPPALQEQFLKLAGDRPVITALNDRVEDPKTGEKVFQFNKWEHLVSINVSKEDYWPEASDKNVLWFSRHEMSDDQKAALGDVNVTQIDRTINRADELKDEIDKADVIAVVAPPALQQQFLKLAGDKPVITALSDRITDPETGEKVFKFNKWEKVTDVSIVKEDFNPAKEDMKDIDYLEETPDDTINRIMKQRSENSKDGGLDGRAGKSQGHDEHDDGAK